MFFSKNFIRVIIGIMVAIQLVSLLTITGFASTNDETASQDETTNVDNTDEE